MSLGTFVRGALGPAEPAVARLYRGLFFDVTDFVRLLQSWSGTGEGAVLDVGCGEGQVTEALAAAFPSRTVLGIDTTARVGRLFRGDASRVAFRRAPVDLIATERPRSFDLVVLCDVLHHVPVLDRPGFLANVGRTVAPGGLLVVKDWARSRSPAYLAGLISDRWVTQDRVSYLSPDELRAEVLAAGVGPLLPEARIRPWRTNIVVAARRPEHGEGSAP